MDKPYLGLMSFLLLGLIASIIGYMDYQSRGSFCNYVPDVGGSLSCETVYSIEEATLMGVIHLSEAAPIFFILAVKLYGIYLIKANRTVFAALTSLLALGSAFVPYLVYLEVYVAEAFCFFCTLMHISIVASFATSLYLLYRGSLL